MRGHDQVAHNDALQHATVIIQLATAATHHRVMHNLKRRHGHLWIICCVRELFCQRRVCVLDVCQPNINNTRNFLHHLWQLVSRGIAHYWERQSRLFCQRHCFNYVWREVQGSYKVNVERTLSLQFKHHLGKALGCDRLAKTLLRDLVILTEHTSERATCEENCTRSSLARDRRLLPEVQR